MITRVLLDKKLLAAFRKHVIAAYPKEYMATLWGRRESPDVITITSIKDVPHTATTGSATAHYNDCVMPDGSRESWIGTIHSHPDSKDSTPSQADWDSSLVCGELMFGIMRVTINENKKFTTETKWWEPRPGITMIHPRIRTVKATQVVEVVVEG